MVSETVKKLKPVLFDILKRVVFTVLLLLLWEAVFLTGINIPGLWKSYNFPSPAVSLKTIVSLAADGILIIAIWASIKRILLGYLLSLSTGALLGIFISKSKIAGKYLRPFILGFQTLPSICWLPFAILWFGLSEGSIIFIIVIGSVFSSTMAIESGIKNINPLYVKAAKTMGAHGTGLYLHVIIPAALPEIVSGMKQGWSFSWRALMAGEMLAATKGLGQILMMGRELADINQVAAIMLVIGLIGFMVDKAVFGKIESEIRYRWGV